MARKNATLRALIEGVLYDLMPKGSVYNIWVDDTTTLAAKLAEVITSLNGKVTPDQMDTAIADALADFDCGVSPEQVAEAIESAILENGTIKRSLLPDGYPYNAMKEIFSVTDGAVTDDGYPVTQPLGLVAGDTYEVNWNGTLYSCVAEGVDMDGLVFAVLGDTAILGGGEPTGKYPFVMIEMPEGMAEGEIYAAVMPLDGSETVTFSVFGGGNIPIDKKWLPEGYPYIIEGGTTVLEETTLVEENGAFLLPVTLNKNATYKVTWNGTPYIVSPMEFANGLGTGVGWGDLSVMGGDATGEPFLIACIDSVGWTVFANDDSTTPTVEIVTEKSYVPMSEKYLSTGGLRLVNGKAQGSMRSANAKPEDETYNMGRNTLAIGANAQGDGINAIALGEGATASGWNSVAIGTKVTSGNDRSIVIGCESNSPGASNIVIGRGCTSGPYKEGLNIFGRYNDPSSMGLFTVGNGTSDSERSNAFKVDGNGNGWFQSGLKVGARSVLLFGDTAPNPNALTFTGAVEGTYDGSEELTINIPSTDEVVQAVLDSIGESKVLGTVDENNVITVTSSLGDGTYILKYENADGTTTEIGQIVIGSGGSSYVNLADTASSDWLTNKRINSSKNIVDVTESQRGDDTVVVTNFIDIVGVQKLHIKGLDVLSALSSGQNYGRFYVYDSNKTLLVASAQPSTTSYVTVADYDSSVWIIDCEAYLGEWGYADERYVRLGGILTGSAADVVITADDNIQ